MTGRRMGLLAPEAYQAPPRSAAALASRPQRGRSFMPELPDVVTYLEAIERRALGEPLERVRLASAFLLRSVAPPLSAFEGLPLRGTRRLGKRLVLEFDGELFLVLHLMIAGRLHWKPHGAKVPGGKRGLAAFDFRPGTLTLTEAGTQKR